MEIKVQNPDGMRLDAQLGKFTVATDQPEADGGADSAPSPFDLFLASLATCAGYYVLAFCRQRNLPTEGIALTMTNDWNDQTHLAENIRTPAGLLRWNEGMAAFSPDGVKRSGTTARGRKRFLSGPVR